MRNSSPIERLRADNITNAYNAANTSGNTVRVSANLGSTLSNKQLNFINTASVQVSVTDNLDGNANISFTTTGAAVSDAYAQANTARTTANDAYAQANTAHNTANGAYSQANGAYAQANGAYAQANAAFDLANLKLNIAGGTVTGTLNVQQNLNVSGDISVNGNLIIGNVNTDTISVVADFTSNLVPDVSNTYNLGTPDKTWNEIFVSTANAATINLAGNLNATQNSTIIVGATTVNTSYVSANVIVSGPTETTYNVFTTNADTPIVIDSFP